jgi:sortase A
VDTTVAPATAGPGVGPRRAHWRTVVRGVGQTLITAGLVILLFVVYELWWTGFTTERDQRSLFNQLRNQWSHGISLANPPLGSGIAILRIPRFGPKYAFVIVQGTSTADLIKGPGHYVDTAMPGKRGNFAVAGHRTTYLHPFYNINELRPGNKIVLETRTMWFTYTVRNIPGTNARYQEIVSPDDLPVAYPVPDQPDPALVPRLKVLTFTSCNPRYSAAQRIVVHGLLTEAQPRRDGLPPALAGFTLTKDA